MVVGKRACGGREQEGKAPTPVKAKHYIGQIPEIGAGSGT